MTMATRLSTPPPPSIINEPPTPRLGAFDDTWEPYSPRKSKRVSLQRAQRAAQTPPAQSPKHSGRSSHSSPPSTIKTLSSTSTSGMTVSPPSTISKKRIPRISHVSDTRRVSGALSEDSAASAALALGLSAASPANKMEIDRSVTIQRNMLPTPAKTPKKPPSESAPEITSIARNLFPVRPETVDEVMPSPKKGRKKYSGFTLDSFGAEDESSSNIEIYTDSHERIPEVDIHPDNPFYGRRPTADPTKRSSKRRKIQIPGEGEQTLEEAEKRDDGLVYVFRGKKVFRKFSEADGDEISHTQVEEFDATLDDELDATIPTRLRGPLTRSSIKPRLLFPTAEQSASREKKSSLAVSDDDEEAVTDIEEPANEVSTPMHQDDFVVTPTAPKFAPFSPPSTARATRSGKKVNDTTLDGMELDGALSSDPVGGRRGRVSPFAAWQRTKSSVMSQSKKREGDSITRTGGEASKKLRGGRA